MKPAITLLFLVLFSVHLYAVVPTDNIETTRIGQDKIHTFYGVSNSHIIETQNQLTLIDMQFKKRHAELLSQYIKSLGKPLTRIILSHNHPDHWFGYTHFDALIYSTPGVKNDLDNRGEEFIRIMQKKMPESVPDEVVQIDAYLPLGQETIDGLSVVFEEYIEHESHHSVVVRIPEYDVIIGQDMFYNDSHLVASDQKRNVHWAELLEKFKRTANKNTRYLVGHGKNTTMEVLDEDILYLSELQKALTEYDTKEEIKAYLIKRFPDKSKKTEGFIDITLRNLLSDKH